MDKEVLIKNISKLHTTELGKTRIINNIQVKSKDVVEYCKEKITNNNCNIYRKGKNWYCMIDNIVITVNSSSYTIITAHEIKEKKR